MRYGLTLSGVPLAHAITACREAYRRLFSLHDWNYFRRFELIHVQAPYSDGTVTYDHATRTVTLTGGTWPSAASFGEIEIDNVRYLIEYRLSDTEIVLPENFNPGSDIAVAQSYQWNQNRYPLSFEVSDIVEIIDSYYTSPLRQVDVRGAMFLSDSYSTQTFPTLYTVFPSQRLPGIREVWFPSAVYGDRQVKILYSARHNPLDVRHKTGTKVTIAGQVATFPSGVLKESHIGCVLRVSENEDIPTGASGRIDDTNSEWGHNPAEFERIILAVDGTTAILSESAASVTDRAWSISSLIDTDSGSMKTLMLRLAEDEYARTADLSVKSIGAGIDLVRSQLIEAQCSDSNRISFTSGYTSNWYPVRVGDIASTTS